MSETREVKSLLRQEKNLLIRYKKTRCDIKRHYLSLAINDIATKISIIRNP